MTAFLRESAALERAMMRKPSSAAVEHPRNPASGWNLAWGLIKLKSPARTAAVTVQLGSLTCPAAERPMTALLRDLEKVETSHGDREPTGAADSSNSPRLDGFVFS